MLAWETLSSNVAEFSVSTVVFSLDFSKQSKDINRTSLPGYIGWHRIQAGTILLSFIS
jgi:hypothetical protein